MKVSRVLSKKVYFDEIELWISASIDSNGRFIEGGVYSCEEHCYNMERDIYNILSIPCVEFIDEETNKIVYGGGYEY